MLNKINNSCDAINLEIIKSNPNTQSEIKFLIKTYSTLVTIGCEYEKINILKTQKYESIKPDPSYLNAIKVTKSLTETLFKAYNDFRI